LGVSQQGEFKNTTKCFWGNVRVENIYQQQRGGQLFLNPIFFFLKTIKKIFSYGSGIFLHGNFQNTKKYVLGGGGGRVAFGLPDTKKGTCKRRL
jgi:hypothetical protein